MTSTLIPQGFGYVGAALVSSLWILIGQTVTVARARNKAKVPYPQAYADSAVAEKSKDAMIFNCAQRAHQNTLEHIPYLYVGSIVTGLVYPIPAAILGATWVASRIGYTRGYASGEPKKRSGPFAAIGEISLILLVLGSTYVSGTWFVQNIRG